MNVKKIMPYFLAALIARPIITGSECLTFLRNFAARWRRSVFPLASYGKII